MLKPPRTPRPFSSIIVAVVYYPPGQSAECGIDMIEYLTRNLDRFLCDRPSSAIVIAGDFNKLNLTRLCNRFNLKKSVTAPTRGHNILDQILTNMRDMYNPTLHLPPLGRSDHQCLLFVPKQKVKAPVYSKRVRLLTPGNIGALSRKIILENWSDVYAVEEIDEKVNAFTSVMLTIIDETVPERKVRMHPSDKPWMTSFIKAKIKARQRVFSRNDHIRYGNLCVTISELISKAKSSYYSSKAKGLRTTNPDKWFKTIFSLLGVNNGNNSMGNISDDDVQDMAEKLQQAFIKPWENLPPDSALDTDMIDQLLRDTTPPLPSIGQVKNCLKHLNPKKATGVDKIPAWILKRFCEDLAPVIHNIVTASINQCKYPSQYKHALVSPVAKVGNPSDIENDFRQISVLPQMAKVIEKIQLQLNIRHLKIKNNQHAFTSGRSTVSALISTTQNWYNATDNSQSGRKGVHVIFIDFRKAFDLVNHNILLEKLASMNFNKSFWLWIKSFLTGRTQQVNLQGILSSTQPCPSGVPQGSVISPSLFNVHINDLEDAAPSLINIDMCKYADDCTQYQIVEKGMCSIMQEAVNELDRWAETNKMVLNPRKTKDMWICFTDSIPEPPRIRIGDEEIERVDSFKLLGVLCQNDLKWNGHVDQIIRKANKSLYHLRQCRKSQLPTEVGLTTYISKIRPVLEYASPIWAGLPDYLQQEIERVQARSLRILNLDRDCLPSLSHRRELATAREIKRIQMEQTHPCHSLLPDHREYSYDLRQTNTFKILSKTKRHKQSFIARACKYM